MSLLTRIENIANFLGKIDSRKVELANELSDTKTSTYWPKTPYGSWNEFCHQRVALSSSSIYVYVRTAALAKDNGFSTLQMKVLVASVGWERFKLGLTKIGVDETIKCDEFIKRYHDLNLNERITFEDEESDLVTLAFQLPQETADALCNALLMHGMRVTNKTRTNLSDAMVKLVAEMLPEA